MRYQLLISILCALFLIVSVFAQIEAKQFDDPKQKTLYKEIIAELRCLVCQNQNLTDSNAPLAKDIRERIYQMLINKKTKQDIIDYMTDRYGEFVLYKPRLTAKTFLLWFSPFLLILFLFFWLISLYKKASKSILVNIDLDKLKQAKQLLKK